MRTLMTVCVAAAFLAACARTTVTGEAGAQLTLDKPSTITIKRGDMAKADIKIHRKDLPGDVMVTFNALPAGVSVVDPITRIVGDGNKAAVTLRAAPDAAMVEKYAAQVTVTAANNTSVTETIEINVREN